MTGVSAAVVRQRIASLLAVDETAALVHISAPTLVLCATRDWVVSKAATLTIMRGIAHAQRVDIDGPHLLLQTCPQECAAAVLAFMRLHGASQSGPANAGPVIELTDYDLCSAFHFSTAAMVFSTCLSGFSAVYS